MEELLKRIQTALDEKLLIKGIYSFKDFATEIKGENIDEYFIYNFSYTLPFYADGKITKEEIFFKISYFAVDNKIKYSVAEEIRLALENIGFSVSNINSIYASMPNEKRGFTFEISEVI